MAMRSERPEDVIDLLMAEHREGEDLLRRLRYAGDAQSRRELADQLIAHLVRHSVVEEACVYPVVRSYLVHGEEIVDHDLDEHDELERVLKDLESSDAADPDFMGVVVELQIALTQHIADEERQQFPQLRRAAPAHELVSLRGTVEQFNRAAPIRMSPGTPPGDLLHRIVGPGEGMVDRLRDVLAGPSSSS